MQLRFSILLRWNNSSYFILFVTTTMSSSRLSELEKKRDDLLARLREN